MKDASSRLWIVFGCGGDRDAGKRPKMGDVATQLADQVIITSDNPRTERPGDIVDQILIGIQPARRAIASVQVDRDRAIRHAIESASPGDVVVIAGKGHETEQVLPDGKGGTIRTHFDDREVARSMLAELHGGRRHPIVAVARTKGRSRR
jgi:UDP-N-acetylmuramoyl-L-alanyl-D-glutamate--2,6-diaminopimelate ligase